MFQTEKDTQARSHAERLAELQESCHRKVQQLQLSHCRQLTATQASVAESLTAAAAPAASAVVAGEVWQSQPAAVQTTHGTCCHLLASSNA